jgi:formate hydrogenlyase subunit 4
MMPGAFSHVFGVALLLAVAPLLPGVAIRTKSLLTGRRGAPAVQLYRDLWKLVRKGAVYSTSTTWMFRLAPVAVLSTALGATLLLPLDGSRAVLSFAGDAIALLYLFGLGRFLLVLGALDTGSSFEGMGASREVWIATFVEPGLFLCLSALAVETGQIGLSDMLGASLGAKWSSAAPALLMIAASLFVLLLAENARVPVDDPATHLELTMVHEVMVLDHGGPDLALILYAGSLKLTVFAALVVAILVPRSALSPLAALAVLVLGMVVVAVGVGIVESAMARLRMPKIPLFIVAGSAAAAMALLLVIY